jgi:transposase
MQGQPDAALELLNEQLEIARSIGDVHLQAASFSNIALTRASWTRRFTSMKRRWLLSPGRAERHGFEYYRHGTLSLYGALNTQTGEVLAKTSARHTSAEFVDFLAKIVDSQPAGREIHVIADNLSAHKTKKVFEFLEANPAVRIHYTPTYSSWLNQVEIWFSKIQRHVISRGVFTSVKDLARKLMGYIRNYNKTATPIRWIYKNVDHRINPAAI